MECGWLGDETAVAVIMAVFFTVRRLLWVWENL